MDDLIYRQQAVDALWKALYDYEDKTEKQFQDSEELDVGDWFFHRIFVQNMSDIDRQTILKLPSAQPEIIRCNKCYYWTKQKDSLQGRCELMRMYPTGGWYCGNAKLKEAEDD